MIEITLKDKIKEICDVLEIYDSENIVKMTINEELGVIEYYVKDSVSIPFERIRRITGYLTGSLDSWNDAKQAECHDRVKHSVNDGGRG